MAVTLSGRHIDLTKETIEVLRSKLRGHVLEPGHAGYDEARRVFNGLVDRRPALIARCSGTADVVDCVRFAREHDLLVSVRGGGHHIDGHAVCDGGLVIDLSPMKGINVAPARKRVLVQAGASWRDVDRETQLFGLIAAGGQISTVGVAGLTLGGGMGNVRRKWGLSSDNLVSADVVTAEGEVLRASETENADLF
jgi:FAD/FMN-containing dehydrogenase